MLVHHGEVSEDRRDARRRRDRRGEGEREGREAEEEHRVENGCGGCNLRIVGGWYWCGMGKVRVNVGVRKKKSVRKERPSYTLPECLPAPSSARGCCLDSFSRCVVVSRLDSS